MDDAARREEDSTPRARSPWNTVGGRVISLVSRKGGVGKTTSAVNLGAALALSGQTVLVVGTDPQCGVCRTLGYGPTDITDGLEDVFAGVSLADLALLSPLDDLHFVSPRILDLDAEERYLANLRDHATAFVSAVERARDLYDTIIIDCPPGLGEAARAALLASDSYLVPVQAEELCRESVESLLEFVDAFRERSSAGALALEGLFLTMVGGRTRMGRHVSARLVEDFGDLVFSTSVPRTTRLSEMALKGRPAVIYDRRSPGSRAYFDLADELVSRYCSGTGPDDSLVDAMLAEMAAQLGDTSATPGEEAASDAPSRAAPPQDDSSSPEMVSLDDLLAEEERETRGDDEGDDWYWTGEAGGSGRLN